MSLSKRKMLDQKTFSTGNIRITHLTSVEYDDAFGVSEQNPDVEGDDGWNTNRQSEVNMGMKEKICNKRKGSLNECRRSERNKGRKVFYADDDDSLS